MKKILSYLTAACLALGFTACEDVPAPYEVNSGTSSDNGNGGGDDGTVEIFATEFDGGATDGFTYSNVSLGTLSYVWSCDASYGYLKASAYAGNACHAAEAWAVSPAINLSDCTKAALSFRHAINKIEDTSLMPAMMTVWVCTDYAGDASTATWTQLNVPTYPDGTSWTFVGSGDMDLTPWCGHDKVYVGLKYTSTDTNAGTWEVDAFKVTGDGTPMSGGDTPDTPVTPTGENLLPNGDFETWTGGTSTPDGWKSASTASSATLSQSTDAHGGTYSVKVGGSTSANKRLGSAELTLKAGTYSLTFFAKAATADGGSVRPGYVPVTDGKAGTYVYGDYTNDLSNSAWTEVNHTFTLAEQATVCIVVMNPKSPGADVLIDDLTLTTSDGGVAGGTDTPQPPVETGSYEKAASIQSGASYLIATLEGGTYKMATAAAASYTYGYLKVKDATAAGDVITTATASEEFVFTAVEGGYTIRDAEGRYLYMTGDFKSFNYSTDDSVEGAVWAVSFNADGTANVRNVLKGKTLQYDPEYTSYGAYDTVTHTLPSLFVKK